MPPDPALIALAKQFAVTNNLYPEIICAVIEQESAWDTWAYRYEPEFYQHYITPLLDRGEVKTRTEATMRATSWGLMQIMGQVAREYGFQGPFLSALCVPETGIRIGCAVFAHKLDLAEGNVTKALQLWNGGGYPGYGAEVLARADKYK